MNEHPGCNKCAEHITELMARAAAAEKERESFRRRLNEHDEGLKEIRDLTIAVKSMGEALERQSMNLDRLDRRLGTLESAPGENWKKMAFEVLKYVVLAVVGAIVLKNI